MKAVRRYKFPVVREIRMRDVMYIMMNTMNSAVHYR